MAAGDLVEVHKWRDPGHIYSDADGAPETDLHAVRSFPDRRRRQRRQCRRQRAGDPRLQAQFAGIRKIAAASSETTGLSFKAIGRDVTFDHTLGFRIEGGMEDRAGCDAAARMRRSCDRRGPRLMRGTSTSRCFVSARFAVTLSPIDVDDLMPSRRGRWPRLSRSTVSESITSRSRVPVVRSASSDRVREGEV